MEIFWYLLMFFCLIVLIAAYCYFPESRTNKPREARMEITVLGPVDQDKFNLYYVVEAPEDQSDLEVSIAVLLRFLKMGYHGAFIDYKLESKKSGYKCYRFAVCRERLC